MQACSISVESQLNLLNTYTLLLSACSWTLYLNFIYKNIIHSNLWHSFLYFQIVRNMNITQIYVIAADNLFFILFILQFTKHIIHIIVFYCLKFLFKYLVYFYVLCCYQFINLIFQKDLLYQTCFWNVTAAYNIINV